MKKAMFILLGFILGIVGSCYAAYKLTANQVSFDKSKSSLNSSDVQEAIDELADILSYGDAIENDILEGKTAIVNGKKITGTLVSISSMKHIKSQWFVESSSLKLSTDASVLVFVTDNAAFTAYHNGVNIGSSISPFENRIWILTCFGDFKTGDTISISKSMNLEVSMYK